MSGEEKDDEGHDGIDRSYNSFCCISANEIAKRAAIVQEAESARKRIEQHGFQPGSEEPVYAVAVVEHCESLSIMLARCHPYPRQQRSSPSICQRNLREEHLNLPKPRNADFQTPINNTTSSEPNNPSTSTSLYFQLCFNNKYNH